uniref:Integrase, catalytic region, zinc finger, CCHC-type, peptidase aspartic, catalytic n=1 Tax=Tanacetum cinerariifolium TaxID=118510 RepID=A0A6L2L057_TANCI|nr:integrase, catalytic region, zinc finger, CCHC-type, peptidase aspartic, catalytic [Tanacetum cinerariifolium]
MWSDHEKKIQKINRFARSLLIQGLPNDIYSLIDNNKTAKDLWDALERHMLSSEYGEQVINDLKKCGYSKDNCELNFKFLNNLQPEWKQYATMMRQNKNLLDINIDALYKILKQNQGEVNDAMKSKKKAVVITSDPLALVAEQTKVRKRKKKVVVSSESEGSDDELKKITALLLAKAFNRKKFYYKPTNNNLRTSSATSSATKKQEGKLIIQRRNHFPITHPNMKKKDLRPTLYDERVIGLGYTSRYIIHSDESLEIEKFKRARENKIEFAYDYGSLNESYVNEKINFSNDYFQEIINPDFKKIDSLFQQTSSLKPYVPIVILERIIIDLEDEVVSLLDKEKENLKIIESLKSKGCESSENEISESKNQSENECQVVEKECDNSENSNVIAPGMFKLSVSQSISQISVLNTSHASNNVEKKTKRKRRNRNSPKQHDKQVNTDVLRANKAFVHFLNLDTFSSVRRSKVSSVEWKKKGSSNTSKDNFSSDNHSNLNKNVKRYSRKDLMMHAYDDVNDLFVFDDIVQICLWIIDSECSKHMTGNRALLTNFMEKFLETVRFGNNDFTMIDGYGDVVIGSMTIKRVYYVEGLGHNLFSVGQFCDKGLEVTFRKSACFVRNENGVDLLTDDSSSNLYTIAINEITLNSSSCLLAKASSSQSWLWHQCLSHLNFAIINILVKNNLARGLPKMKFEKDHLCFVCEQGKIHQKHRNARTPQQNGVVERRNRTLVEAARTMLTFANLPLFLWAKAITTACFTQNHSIIHKRFDKTPYELINKRNPNIKFFHVFGCRCYLLNDYDDVGKLQAKGDIGVFVGYSKDSAAFRVYNKPSKKDLEDLFQKFYDEYFDSSKLKKSLTTNVETSNNEGEVFHKVSESFQGESSSSSINDDVYQSLEEGILPQTNTQSISNNMIPNVDEASSSHNVFYKRLEDANFDARTAFHDTFDVHTYYQPYPHETKLIKDHPLYIIICDPKSSVRTRGQLANSCLFTCLLSSIEPANVVEALKDAYWVIAMQDELDQIARLKVWRLVPKPERKTIIKAKWIFKNKKDESCLVIQNKARLVAVRYSQQEGIDYDETFSLAAFLNGILKEEVYVAESPGFVSK